MTRHFPTAALLVLLAGCLAATSGCREGGVRASGTSAGLGTPADPGDAAAQTIVHDATMACLSGEAERALARLDTLVAARPSDVDALATRGMCRRVRFAADSSRADAEGAMADLTEAIQQLGDGASPRGFTLDRLYAHRAYVHEALDHGNWSGAVADLERAAAAAPDEPTHRLDLGIARNLAGDRTGAIADLRRFLEMAPGDAERGAVVRRHLAALGDPAAAPPSAR